MSRDYQVGSDVYFLDRIDTSAEHILSDVREMTSAIHDISSSLKQILAIEQQAQERNVMRIAQEEAQQMARQRSELTDVFGAMMTLATQPQIIVPFIKALDKELLAKIAKSFSELQDMIHVQTMRDLRDQSVKDGAKLSDNLEEVTAPIVGIVPRD